jgi:two-component system, chemotaxis family, protein-glutamate methylesterase/glutaminase
MALRKIRVLMVDDAPIERKLLAALFAEEPDMDVVGFASAGNDVRTRIKLLEPFAPTLDLQMHGMGGLRSLQNLMRLRPMPVVVCSGVEATSPVARDAVAAGAARFVSKSVLATGSPVAFSRRDHDW